eukprot:g4438.t1
MQRSVFLSRITDILMRVTQFRLLLRVYEILPLSWIFFEAIVLGTISFVGASNRHAVGQCLGKVIVRSSSSGSDGTRASSSSTANATMPTGRTERAWTHLCRQLVWYIFPRRYCKGPVPDIRPRA